MAEKIGNGPPQFIRDVEMHLNVPVLLTNLCVSEEHIQHIQAIQLLAGMLDDISHRVIETKDPVLLELLFKMKLLKVIEPEDQGEFYEDV